MIGVLDWGIGGLFTVERMLAREPTLDLAVLSDAGNVPYGRQSRPQLRASVRSSVARLRALGAGPILVACHSASTVLPELDLKGVEGVVRPEAVPLGGTILVLGGIRTIRSGAWRRALQHIHHPATAQALDRILAPGRAADTVVLACTHYIALAPLIQARMPHATIVDPAIAWADTIPLPSGARARVARTTGAVDHTNSIAARLLPSVADTLMFQAWTDPAGVSP